MSRVKTTLGPYFVKEGLWNKKGSIWDIGIDIANVAPKIGSNPL